MSVVNFITAQNPNQKIEELIAQKVADNYFEGTVLIAEQGVPVFEGAYGYQNQERTVAIKKDTRFNIASITKMLTAIVVMQLVDEGQLSLESALDSLLPGLEIPNSKQITPHHLLLHISGLPNDSYSTYQQALSPKEYVTEILEKGKINSSLGEFNYANIDYVLLGMTIESITGNSWQREIEDRIISKLDLGNTGFLRKGDSLENFARSFQVSPEGNFIPYPDIYIENYSAAGAMYSNISDLLLIDQAMYSEILLSQDSKAAMFTSYPEYNYTGYGVWTYNYPFLDPQPKIMERRGGIMGSNSVLVRFLENNKTLIILSNNNRFNPDSFGDFDNLREALIMELGK